MPARFPPRIFRRVPFEAELRIRFDEGGEELVARSANLSLGGMFVVTDPPRPVGSSFELSFKLPEQPAPVRGRGKVIWTREQNEGSDRLAGMGIRFLELTPGSRELIFEVVDRRVRDGSPYDDGGEDEETGSIADRGVARPSPAPSPAPPPAAPETPPQTPPASAEPAPPAAAVAPGSSPPPPAAEPGPADPAEQQPGGGPTPPAQPPPPPEPPPAVPVAADPDATTAMHRKPPAPPAAGQPPGASEPVGGEVPVRLMDRADETGGGDILSADDSAVTAADRAPAVPNLPPVEMPEPERPAYAMVGGAYAGRVRRGRRFGLGIVVGLVIVLAAAVAGYLLLGGESVEALLSRAPWVSAPPAAEEAADSGPVEDGLGGEADRGATAEPALPASAVADLSPGGTAGDGVPAAAPRRSEPSTDPPPADPSSADAQAAGDSGIDPTATTVPSAADPAAPVARSGVRARRVTGITFHRVEGATELVIWGDGVFSPGSWRHSRLGGEQPREVIRLVGIEEPFADGTVEVGTPHVSRVRTGHHLETDPDELHVVVDLAAGNVAVSELRGEGSQLRLRVEER